MTTPRCRGALWQHTAAQSGAAELLVGVTGLGSLSSAASAISLIAAAARSGRLVGGTVALR